MGVEVITTVLISAAAPTGGAPYDLTDLATVGEGEVRVRVMRGGYPDANGAQCQLGRIIRLPRDTAETAAKTVPLSS